MKIALTVATRDALPQALVVLRGIDESLPKAAELGYDGVEIYVFDRSNIDAPRVKRLLHDCGLAAPVFSVGQIFLKRGLTFVDPDPAVRKEAVGVFNEIVDLAGEFGADVNTSRMRGAIPEGESLADTLSRLTECMQQVCARASTHGTSILIEQMNRYESNYLCSVGEVAEYLRAAGISNLLVHPDTYHMNIEDPDFISPLEQHLDVIRYIHFSDSNRLSPGSGHIDFPSIIRALREKGYDRWVGVEVLAQPTADEAARASIEYLRRYIPAS